MRAADDEKPQRKVTISRPFYLGVYEVTQYEYRQVMNDNPSKFKDSELLPVEQVSWLDAVKFCNKLSERERRKPYYKIEDDAVTILGGNGYRLPTEAEWEYACRPQSPETATKYPFGDDDDDLSSYAWFDKNSDGKTHPVGQKKPNRWGLYDMQGNVWEWCQDWYSDKYYTFAPESDPPGPASASLRVFRGGGWAASPGTAARRTAAGTCRRSGAIAWVSAWPQTSNRAKLASNRLPWSGGRSRGRKAEPTPDRAGAEGHEERDSEWY